MQEKAKEKRGGLTARLQSKDLSVSRKRLAWICKQAVWGGIAYLIGLGSMAFDTKPLGIALLCAGGGNLIGVLLGLIVSELALMRDPILMISTYVAAAAVRAISSMLLESPDARVALPTRVRDRLRTEKVEKNEPANRLQALWKGRLRAIGELGRAAGALFTESLRLRMAIAAVGMLVVSLFHVITGGFRYYDWFGAVFSVLVAPAAVVVFSVRAEGKCENKVLRAISSAALIYAVVWSSNLAAIASIPVSAILSLLVTLYTVEENGVAFGVGAAAVAGLAYRPMEIPSLLIAALILGGIQWKRRETVGVPLACLGAFGWSAYVMRIAAFTVSLPAYLAAGAVFSVLLQIKKSQRRQAEEPACVDPETELRCARSRHEDANDRFRNISDAFSSLSELFYNLSDRLRRPGTLDLRRICDGSFDTFCTDCPNKTVCWGLEYSDTLTVVNGLISHLHTKGRVSEAQIPVHLRQRCPSIDRILLQINTECARFTADLLRNNRTEIFAMDYEAAANIINDALAEDDGEYRFDTELEARVFEYLSDAGITVQSVSVYGMRRRQILMKGVNVDRSAVTMETLRSDLGEMCGLELGAPRFEVENNATSMMLQTKRKLSVNGAQNNLSADGGVSGDTVNLFSNRKDYFYALISDGMGAGREAAFTSNLCSAFLEKMLRAGNRANTSLRMLNNMILSRCRDSAEECSSTIDLIELDLITGRASFIKGGAAPSFVIRKGHVHRLQAGTAPIGIIRTLDTQEASFELQEGDTVVMISDGIQQNDPDCSELSEYLATCGTKDPEEIVSEICRSASEHTDHDDCSAIALRICSSVGASE